MVCRSKCKQPHSHFSKKITFLWVYNLTWGHVAGEVMDRMSRSFYWCISTCYDHKCLIQNCFETNNNNCRIVTQGAVFKMEMSMKHPLWMQRHNQHFTQKLKSCFKVKKKKTPGSPFGLEDKAPWTSWMLNFGGLYRLSTSPQTRNQRFGHNKGYFFLSSVATSLPSRKYRGKMRFVNNPEIREKILRNHNTGFKNLRG